MPTKKITEKKKVTKHSLLKEITLQIATAAGMLRETLGEKKFDKRIKKAVKLLTDGLKSSPSKKAAGKKRSAKKTAKKAAKTLPLKKTAKAIKK